MKTRKKKIDISIQITGWIKDTLKYQVRDSCTTKYKVV